jgi:kinesin family protein 2/24
MRPTAAGGNNRGAPSSAGGPSGPPAKPKSTLGEIQRLQRERDERRRLAEDRKQERAAEERRLREAGNLGDVDFVRMVQNYREEIRHSERRHATPGSTRICICVRKRPINGKEVAKRDHDCVSCLNPSVVVHACKLRVDGITKYLDNQCFEFDHTFNEGDSTDDVYMYTAQPLVEFALMGGRSTVFACK